MRKYFPESEAAARSRDGRAWSEKADRTSALPPIRGRVGSPKARWPLIFGADATLSGDNESARSGESSNQEDTFSYSKSLNFQLVFASLVSKITFLPFSFNNIFKTCFIF